MLEAKCATGLVSEKIEGDVDIESEQHETVHFTVIPFSTWRARVGSEIPDRPSLILPLVRTIKIYNRIWTIYIIDRR